MKKYLLLLLITMTIVTFGSCTDNEEYDNMLWEVVSNSDPESIRITNQSNADRDNPSIVHIKAWYQEGDVVLRCTNHTIAFTLIGPNDNYINESMGFTITRVDANTLKIHFKKNAKGTPEEEDTILVTNADQGTPARDSFISITRTFGELELPK